LHDAYFELNYTFK